MDSQAIRQGEAEPQENTPLLTSSSTDLEHGGTQGGTQGEQQGQSAIVSGPRPTLTGRKKALRDTFLAALALYVLVGIFSCTNFVLLQHGRWQFHAYDVQVEVTRPTVVFSVSLPTLIKVFSATI